MRAFISWADLKGRHRVELLEDTTLIGRQELAPLRIAHESVSRRHAELLKEDDRLLIRDLGSMNGTCTTRHPDKITEATELENGEEFSCGAIPFRVELLPDETADNKTMVLPQIPTE